MVNYQACHTAGSKNQSSSPHDAMSLSWLVTGQVSPEGSEQLFVSRTVVQNLFGIFSQITYDCPSSTPTQRGLALRKSPSSWSDKCARVQTHSNTVK